ncbi:MAG: hypothetical protein NTV76_00545 [Pseudomonas sp.]|nr:hypothetical protein [Pseudomonas sp.]
MSTDRQKSFIASIGTESSLLHFLDLLYAQRALVTSSFASGGFFTGRRQSRNDSHFLGLRPEIPVNAKPRLILYFRYTGSDYRLYIRTPGPYYGKCLSISDEGLLGAFPSAGSTTFNLIDNRGSVLTLDTIKEDTLNVYLRPKNSGLVHVHNVHDSKYIYIADKGGAPLSFNLMIQERNASYISYPDEI